MRNKVIRISQSGKTISKAVGLQSAMLRAIMRKWLKQGTAVNLPRSRRPTKITSGADVTLPRGHKGTQDNIPRTADLTYLS